MSYEYNGHLIDDERVNLVAHEIMDKYPEIDVIKAEQIARLEGSISTEPNINVKFNRLYNIMLIMHDDENFVIKVFKDLLMVFKKNRFSYCSDYYDNILKELLGFLEHRREFPYLDEFLCD